ncbi:MAG: hypothetical protein NTV87_16315 [Ignavibacteriae bacterium]|nr:hypothetical protein [Ignavibacteriota bacterium]
MNNNHPFDPFIPKEATKLIIGTIPPGRFCLSEQRIFNDDVKFYYGSNDNSFWDILGHIFNIEFLYENTDNAVNQRKKFLSDSNLGITDILQSCFRKNSSSLDKDLSDLKFKDIQTILTNNPVINTLIYTSKIVKSFMYNSTGSYHESDKTDSEKKYIKINGKKYTVWVLYSPSRNGLRRLGKDGKQKRIDQYKKVFTSKF